MRKRGREREQRVNSLNMIILMRVLPAVTPRLISVTLFPFPVQTGLKCEFIFS